MFFTFILIFLMCGESIQTTNSQDHCKHNKKKNIIKKSTREFIFLQIL